MKDSGQVISRGQVSGGISRALTRWAVWPAGDDAEENEARVGRGPRRGPVTPARLSGALPAGHHVEEARQSSPAKHGTSTGAPRRAPRAPRRAPRRASRGAPRRAVPGAPRASRRAARLLNLAQRAPHLTPRAQGCAAGARWDAIPSRCSCFKYYLICK